MQKLKLFLATATAALFLTACSSKEPMDYLPDAGAYIAVNAAKVRGSEGGKKVADALDRMQPGGPSVLREGLQKVYIGIDGGPRSERSAYSVAIGTPGMPAKVMADVKAAGGVEKKMAGRTVVTSGPLSMTAVGDTGLLLFQKEAELNKMISTSKKKNPAAAQSSAFGTLKAKSEQHAAVMIADAAPLLGYAGPQLQQLSKFHAEGAEALQQVKAISLTVDWESQPVVVATLHLPGEEAREDLNGLVNMALGMASTFGGNRVPAPLQAILKDLEAATNEEGVTMALQIPQEQANRFLETLKTR